MSSAVHVLFVDRDPGILGTLKRVLALEPYVRSFCSSAVQALTLVAAHDVDVVVTSHLLPGMNGLELLNVLRHERPWVQRLLLTGDPRGAWLGVDIVDHFIAKPWNRVALVDTLQRVVERAAVRRRARLTAAA